MSGCAGRTLRHTQKCSMISNLKSLLLVRNDTEGFQRNRRNPAILHTHTHAKAARMRPDWPSSLPTYSPTKSHGSPIFKVFSRPWSGPILQLDKVAERPVPLRITCSGLLPDYSRHSSRRSVAPADPTWVSPGDLVLTPPACCSSCLPEVGGQELPLPESHSRILFPSPSKLLHPSVYYYIPCTGTRVHQQSRGPNSDPSQIRWSSSLPEEGASGLPQTPAGRRCTCPRFLPAG